MFGIGMPELLIILVIALVVIGPHKLPELARSIGKGLAELKKAANDVQRNIEAETRAMEEKERLEKARESAAEAGAVREPPGEIARADTGEGDGRKELSAA